MVPSTNFAPTEFPEVHPLLLLGRSAKGVYPKFRNIDVLTEGVHDGALSSVLSKMR
jgi:hypothetical protein